MKLPKWLLIRLQHWALDKTDRLCDEVIIPGAFYRWHIFRLSIDRRDSTLKERIKKLCPKIYIHVFQGDDDDRALHDHPGASISFMLEGTILEHMDGNNVRIVRKGDIIYRPATHRHRLTMVSGIAMTLFIFGPNYREWGFWPDGKFVPWQEFISRGEM